MHSRLRYIGLAALALLILSNCAWAAPYTYRNTRAPSHTQRRSLVRGVHAHNAMLRASAPSAVHQFFHHGVLYTVDYNGNVIAVGSYSGNASITTPGSARLSASAPSPVATNPISANRAPAVSAPGSGFDLQAALNAQRRQPQVYYVLSPAAAGGNAYGAYGAYGSPYGSDIIQNYAYSFPLSNTNNQTVITGAVMSGAASGPSSLPSGITSQGALTPTSSGGGTIVSPTIGGTTITTAGGVPVITSTGLPLTTGAGGVPVIVSPGAFTTNALIPVVTSNGALIPTFTTGTVNGTLTTPTTFTNGIPTVPSTFSTATGTTTLIPGSTTGTSVIVGPGVLGTGGGLAVPTFTGSGGVRVPTVPVPSR